jgi:hypothetical protein
MTSIKITVGLLLAILVLTGCNGEEKDIPAPNIYFYTDDDDDSYETDISYEIDIDDTLTLSPKIIYDYDGSYTWYLNGEFLSSDKIITVIPTTLGSDNYAFVVETPYGSDSTDVLVSTILDIDFSELELDEDEDDYDTGEDLVDTDGGFISSYAFFPVNPGDDDSWTGFALSNMFNTSLTDEISPFSAYATQSSDEKFMIYQMPETPEEATIQFLNDTSFTISEITIANSTLAYYLMKYGNDDIPYLQASGDSDGDWVKLTFEGFDKYGISTDTVEFFLADYRFESSTDNYIISEWSTVDLEKLGKINKLSFIITTSVTDETGIMITPKYLCINNIKLIE